MRKLKGKDEKAYTGCEKGGVYAVYNDKQENVGNFADEAAAVQLGGYELAGEDKSEPPEGVKNDSSAKVESGKAGAVPAGEGGHTPTAQPQAGQGGEITQDPKTDNKKDSPQTEETPA